MGCTRKGGKDKVTMEKCKCAGKYRGPDLVKSSHTLTAAKGEEKCVQSRKKKCFGRVSPGRGQKKGKKITEALCRWQNAAFCQHNSWKKRERDEKEQPVNAKASYHN